MTDPAKGITGERYSQGFTYHEFLGQVESNRERYDEHEAAFKLSDEDAKSFKAIAANLGGLKALAIVEDWCPDAHRGLPVMGSIAEAAGMELRVFYRDKNPDIMDLYLNQGKFQSIPVFAFFDEKLNPLCHWIERPAAATRFMDEIGAELSQKKLTEDEIRQERRQKNALMADNWRQETVVELKNLLSKVTPQT